MSSIEQVKVNVVVVEKKPKAKSFAQKDKKTMFSIMGFLLNLKEQGVLDDEKVLECLEALPLYKTAADKTAFFQHEMFDTKKVEDELYKPMVSDYKKAKKQAKKPRAKKEAVEEKKPRAKKEAVEEKKPRAKKEAVKEKKPRAKKEAVEGAKKEVVVEEEVKVVVEEEVKVVVEEEVKVVVEGAKKEGEVKEKKPKAKKEKVVVEGGEPKRGRKPKEQIVELAQEQSNNSVEEESLDVLIQSMNIKETPGSVPVLEEIQVEDVDNILRELEAEEIVEDLRVSTPVLKEKKKPKSTETKVNKKNSSN